MNETEPKVPINILLVDDRSDGMLVLETVLQGQGYNLFKASSGEDGLRCFLRDDFAVVLLDVLMPGMDGFQTARRMHSNQGTKKTPIIFVTAINIEKQYVPANEVGAIDVLRKPFDAETLRLKVAVFVNMYRLDAELQTRNEPTSHGIRT